MNEETKTVTARAVTEYGVTFDGGVRDGEVLGPLNVIQISYWNQHWWSSARLITRTRWVYDEPEEWVRANDEQIDFWNKNVLVPHVLATVK